MNFTMLAQNSVDNYVLQACLAAMSIRSSNPGSKICLITNDDVPEKYIQLFDDIVEIPWGDKAKDIVWKVNNRYKIYHATPYNETAVIDTDMLVLDDISHWNRFLESKELHFVNKVKTYRGETVTSNYYRRAFVDHNLPNLYSGFHYFKKSSFAHSFYDLLENVMNNWDEIAPKFPSILKYQNSVSVDISAALVTKMLDCEEQITSKMSYPTFVHMKLHCQDWKKEMSTSWQQRIGVYFNDNLELKIGNYRQHGIFHYTEKSFASPHLFSVYERHLGI